MSKAPHAVQLVVVKAADLRRTLRLSRSGSYRVLKLAGAVKVGDRLLRLPVSNLIALLGEDLARTVIAQAEAIERADGDSP